MFHLTFNHDLNKFETFYAGLWSFSHLGGKNLFFPRLYLPEFYRSTYRPVQNLPTLGIVFAWNKIPFHTQILLRIRLANNKKNREIFPEQNNVTLSIRIFRTIYLEW